MSKRILYLVALYLGVVLLIAPAAVEASAKKDLAFAVSLAEKGLWREAAYRFEVLARKSPSNGRLWNNVAVAYEAAGQYDKAHAAYERAATVLTPDLEEFEQNRDAFEAFYIIWKASQAVNG